jgi:GntR family transcriptional regulator
MTARLNSVGSESPSGVLSPRHHQVYVVLKQQIIEGAYPLGQALPSEHELASLFSVSRITIRRALDRLEDERLIKRRRGLGTYPQPPLPQEPLRANLRGLLENLLAMGLKTAVQVISFDYVAASAEVARAMEIPIGTTVQKTIRVRRLKGTPFSHLTTYVPESIGRSFNASDLAEKPLLVLLEQAGVTVARADQTITAKLADTVVAPLLEMEVGTALLSVKRQVRDQAKQVVEYIEALYRPDLYEYQMSMLRVAGTGSPIWAPDGAGQGETGEDLTRPQ